MPRGTRSINHGDGRRAGGASTETISVITTEKYLLAQCWCQTAFVKVPTIHVRRGNTGSCGLKGCGPSLNRPAAPGRVMRPVNSRQWTEANPVGEPSTYTEKCAPNDDLIEEQRAAAPRGLRPTSGERAARRDMVEQLWREGKKLIDIATRLNLPFHTVSDDVKWLRDNERIQYRYQDTKRQRQRRNQT